MSDTAIVFMVISGLLIGLAIAIIAVLLVWSWPGRPRKFLDEGDPTGLEDEFVVCWWEQRGAVFLPSLRTRDYTLADKINLWRGKAAMGISSMWQEMLTVGLAEQIPRVDVPVHFLHGVHDYTCAHTEALTYFDGLTAPLKGFYTFEESAHSPVFEEPDKVMTVLREDVLNGTNRLADRT